MKFIPGAVSRIKTKFFNYETQIVSELLFGTFFFCVFSLTGEKRKKLTELELLCGKNVERIVI
jgi:hypothetical protein